MKLRFRLRKIGVEDRDFVPHLFWRELLIYFPRLDRDPLRCIWEKQDLCLLGFVMFEPAVELLSKRGSLIRKLGVSEQRHFFRRRASLCKIRIACGLGK